VPDQAINVVSCF